MSDPDTKEFDEFIRKWAWKKMRKLEKKLGSFAAIYFGEPMAIVYARNGTKIIHQDGEESEVMTK